MAEGFILEFDGFGAETYEAVSELLGIMAERLGPARREGGVDTPPTRSEWLDLAAHHHLG
jgi:hypothetical protein